MKKFLTMKVSMFDLLIVWAIVTILIVIFRWG